MLTIWSNARLPESCLARLRAGVAPHRLLVSTHVTNNLGAAGPDPSLEQADIALGQPDPEQLLRPLKLKWVQLTSASYTRYDRADLRESLKSRGIFLTNSSSVFNEPCAEHVLAFMLAHARALPQSMINQFSDRAWPIENLRNQCRLLAGQSVLLLGFGSIARRLVELLQQFHMNIHAIRQSPRGDEPIIVHPTEMTSAILPQADHVVDVLPASAATNHFMDAARFAAMKPGAVFYNIGRGATVDQSALIGALTSGRISAAFLDVTDPEPLPPDHPLWKTPNCFITPHIAGGHIDEFDRSVDHFLGNFKNFQANSPLLDRVF